jgi:hypothetical protein
MGSGQTQFVLDCPDCLPGDGRERPGHGWWAIPITGDPGFCGKVPRSERIPQTTSPTEAVPREGRFVRIH